MQIERLLLTLVLQKNVIRRRGPRRTYKVKVKVFIYTSGDIALLVSNLVTKWSFSFTRPAVLIPGKAIPGAH
jgi:hypothetical protein